MFYPAWVHLRYSSHHSGNGLKDIGYLDLIFVGISYYVGVGGTTFLFVDDDLGDFVFFVLGSGDVGKEYISVFFYRAAVAG